MPAQAGNDRLYIEMGAAAPEERAYTAGVTGWPVEPGNDKGTTRRRSVVRLILVPGLLLIGLLLSGIGSPAKAAEGTAEGDETAPSLPEPTDASLRNRERQALIAFYEALGGPDWIQRDFWGSDRPVSNWHGVETDADGRVVRLTIYDNNLTGELSPAICALERLHTLHLSFNKISGSLPDELGDCRALKNLWL
jgi:hypothetical protein